MNKSTHTIYISTLVAINIIVLCWLIYKGYSYYQTPVVERFYHEDHAMLKPSGPFGHGYGIVGTLLILIGVFSYIARKKVKAMSGLGRLKYWLEFHIFLCSLGPMLVLFHTAFKFGGLVSVSFWSMVAVVASGVIGRFIYIQIPRTIEGRELSLAEANALKLNMSEVLQEQFHIDENHVRLLTGSWRGKDDYSGKSLWERWYLKFKADRSKLKEVGNVLRELSVKKNEHHRIINLFKKEIALNHKIDRLHTMQRLFRYWHVAHLPFAFIMLIIMVVHVVITLMFGYRWIF
ncbi:MAG: hypothetical protein IPM34_00135 [Saprospiraceae bacterium]|nr:hypothetical protein [Saprospiraceae bacterium]